MANRRFEMYHYRQALVRMRQGESDQQIHATGLMGRRTRRQDQRSNRSIEEEYI
jgi:hypothetical protein